MARRPRPAPPTARTADRYALYTAAVQCVESEIDFVERTFRRLRGRRADLLREDFCGTAASSCEFVSRHAARTAVGVDIDPAPLAWARRHRLAALPADARARVRLDRRSVLEAGPFEPGRGYDAVLAMNFSYWTLRTRALMLDYARAVRASLAPDGLFFLDFYGGCDVHRELEERRRIRALGGFTYVWDQHRLDPVSGTLRCYIHFEFADGSRLRRAFSYTWRIWTFPELRDIFLEAGFREVHAYLEGDDGRGGGNGIFRRAASGAADRAFIAYVLAVP